MKNFLAYVVVVAFVFSTAIAIEAKEHGHEHKHGDKEAVKQNPQTTCPVTGEKVDKTVYAEYEGKRVYFCCEDCVEKFKENPKQYVEKLEKEGVTLEKVGKPQKMCPVMNAPVRKNLYVDHEGERVYFCCGGCVSTFKKNPEKYLEKMRKDGVELEKVPVEKK